MAPLLGALFAVFVGMLAIRPYLAYQRQSFQMVQASNTASQFRQIINAATIYVQENCLPNQSTGNIPPSCSNIPLSALQATGLLPSNITSSNNPNGLNPYGQQWSIAVSQVSNPNMAQGAPQLQALLYSSGGSTIPPQIAPEIAAQTGQEGGFVPSPSQYAVYNVQAQTAVGAYGHWAAAAPSGATQGHLVALLDVGAGQDGENDNDYLYRTAVPGDTNNTLNTMRTSLNMGGNNINNATTVNAGTVNATQTIGIPSASSNTNNSQAYLAQMLPLGNGGEVAVGDGGDAVTIAAEGGGTAFQEQSPVGIGANVVSSTTSANGAAFAMQSSNPGANPYQYSSLQESVSTKGSGAATISESASGAAIFNLSGASSALNIGGSGAELSVGGSSGGNSTNAPLALIGAPQAANTSCTQVGVIAPNLTGTGMPVVCFQANSSATPTWQPLGGGDFSQSKTVTTIYPEIASSTSPSYTIQNNSTKPIFLSTNCVPQFPNIPLLTVYNGNKFNVSIQVFNGTNLVSTNTSRQYIPVTGEDFGGTQGTNANVAPYVSAMVPSGDQAVLWLTTDQTVSTGSAGGYCNIMETY